MTRRSTTFACLAGAVLLLGGCTPVQWVREGASPEQLQQDLALCQREAWREAMWNDRYYRPFGPVFFDSFGRPYYAWPYASYADPFGDRFLEESRLTQFCMRLKGYELQPVPKSPAPK